MCGIAGLFLPDPAAGAALRPADTVRSMMGTLTHRGPDAEGIWSDPKGRCILGHRRLSIIDTSDAGRQPMMTADGRWVISFNGEIYNFLELKPQLESLGVHFCGRTDTEVLIEGIARWGTEALEKLDGMFAIAAFDTVSGELLLARDPFGEKPLYYVELPAGGIAFASELQALEKLPGFDGEVSLDAMAEVLMFQYIGAPRTIYRQVKKLQPGHWLRAKPGRLLESGRYFEFRPGDNGFTDAPMDGLVDQLEDIMVRSIKRRLISDVPLGAFLSGGVDSSTVCALIRRKLNLPMKTFSIGFEGAEESEHEAAQAYARHLGTEHHDQILVPDTSEFLENIGRVLDEPNADSSCMPTFLLSRFARRFVTVAVSGDGGDEMFLGYGRYFDSLREEEGRNRSWQSGWFPGRVYYSDRILVSMERHIKELFGAVPDGLASHVATLRGEIDRDSLPLFCRLRKTDVVNYMPGAVLPKVDRMSMQHSLEVRTPYLNVELARFAERLPLTSLYREGRGKILLRELAYRYLPRELVDAPKRGFAIPVSRWGREPLLRVVGKLLSSEDSRLKVVLGPAAIDRFLERQRSRSGYSTYQVWAVITLESWLRHHPANLPAPRPSAARPASLVDEPFSITSESALLAYPLGNKTYAVVEASIYDGNADESTEDRLRGLICSLPKSTRRRTDLAFSLILDLHTAKAVPIPGWGLRLRLRDRIRLMKLRGATLLFPIADASQRLDSRELQKFQDLGISALVFRHPHRDTTWAIRFNLRRKPWLSRVHDLMRLRGSSIPLPKDRIKQLNGHFVIGPLREIEGDPETELSDRYMLFEGSRQLPPVPVGHEQIGLLGGGRYSIWEQQCLFSSSEPPRFDTSDYWVVKKTPETEPMLPVTAEIQRIERDYAGNFIGKVQALFSGNGRSVRECIVEPGDRIVVLTHALPPGGAERQWCYLAKGLKDRGYDVTFVVTEDLVGVDAHYLPLLRRNGIEPVSIRRQALADVLHNLSHVEDAHNLLDPDASPLGARIPFLTSLLLSVNPKVVFAQLDNTNVLAALAGRLAAIPKVVISFRNYNPSHFSYLRNDWYQPCYRFACQSPSIICAGNARAANEDYANWIGIPHTRVHWIPNAIDAADFKRPHEAELAALRREFGLTAGEPVILGAFRLAEEKRPLIFLDVCACAAKAVQGLKVLIAGVGPLMTDLHEKVRELGLEGRVHLLGPRSDISSLMAISSLVLLTSRYEGMPNVVMEAQLLGVPVVSTRVGGIADCVKDGDTGLLADVDDAASLTSACIRLLQDGELRRKMGHAATAWMTQYFSKDMMVERYLSLTRAVQNKRPEASIG